MGDLLGWWADKSQRWRVPILATWLVLVLLGALAATSLPAVLRGGGWSLSDSEASMADRRLAEGFGWDTSRTDTAVFSSDRLDWQDPPFQDSVRAALARLKAQPGVARLYSPYTTGDRRLVSPDGHVVLALVSYAGSPAEIERRIPAYRRALGVPAALAAHLTGPAAFNVDIDVASQEDLRRVETYTMPVVLALVVAVFGSFLAGLLPVALGLAAVALTMGVLALWGRFDTVSTFAPNAASMLGLGLGIDFSLLYISRFREELSIGHPVPVALERTLQTSGRSILYSGLTLAAAMAVVAGVTNAIVLRSMSIAIVLVTLFALAAALTLLPTLLGVFGQRMAARRPIRQAAIARLWGRWAHLVMQHPWRWTLASSLLLALLAWPTLGMIKGFPEAKAISTTYESRRGFDAMARAFGKGQLSPLYLTVRTEPEGLWKPGFRMALSRWVQRLERDPRIARVDAWPHAVGEARYQALSPMALAFDPLSRLRSNVWANLDGKADTTYLVVIPKADGNSQEVRGLMRDLRADRGHELSGLGAEVLVGGVTASVHDFDRGVYGRFPAMIAGVVLITFGVLLLFLRSFWLPVKAVVMTCASILASYGVLTAVFQHGVGAGLIGLDPPGQITIIVPVLLFATLFGLSTDYEVFLLTRVRELHDAGHSDEGAVATGLAVTGRVITAAALIMGMVFMTFSFSGMTVIKEIGVGLTIGVLLDATVVRIVLVPATMRLLGQWNWWLPASVARWLPALSHEGPVQKDEPTAARP
ncbi:MAG TPA: MMPL family transporter [Stenomitos sp.]